MKRKQLTVLGVLLGLAVLLFLVLSRRSEKHVTSQSPTPPNLMTQATSSSTAAVPPQPLQAEQRKQAVELVKSIYSAPIVFYGRAQDQHGQSLAGAKVQYSALDKFWEPGTKYEGVTDANGFFSITGIQGAAISVQVSKEGYDRLYNQSDGAFSFGTLYDPQRDRPTPTKDAPAVFVLRKKAPAEPLVRVRSRQYDVSKNGAPVIVNLETGKPASVGQGHLQFECWTDDKTKDEQGHFDWKCRVSVPNGGLIERDPQHDFEAPQEGYRDAAEIVISGNDPRQRWSSEVEREYFLKLADGRHARVKLTAFVGSRTFFVLESYLNPSGSRNLEYNAALQAAAR